MNEGRTAASVVKMAFSLVMTLHRFSEFDAVSSLTESFTGAVFVYILALLIASVV
jgi:hypothetical protein